jgi:hypothetical protein
MGIADQLNALRRDSPILRVATFADLSSGLVLFASTSRRLPQERLDALLRPGARDPERVSAQDGGGAARRVRPREAIDAEGDGLLVFVRSPTEDPTRR